MKEKKLVSYCLFTYNQEKYIQASILGALNQSYSPLEIIISDDCSTDSTYAIIQKTIESYDGPHRIIVNRNETNLGIGGHVSKICNEIASGEYIVLLAGDDISKPNHVKIAYESMQKFPDIHMIDFCADIINSDSEIINESSVKYSFRKFELVDYLNLNHVESFGPGRIVKKEVFKDFGSISKTCPTEDSVMVLRSLLLGGFIRSNFKTVFYRKHDSNISNTSNISNLSNTAIISQYLTDLTHFYNNSLIGDQEFQTILKRILLEYKLRRYKYLNYSNIIKKLFKRLIIKVLEFNYLIMKKLFQENYKN
jgi:glycosyltransferase involved in cell wall biosynthesis